MNNNSAIYDDESFFENYLNLRKADNNYNDLIEQPIVLSLLDDIICGKDVLDIGCGYGAMTVKIADGGARRVVGLDISNKMIQKGIEMNSRTNIQYIVGAAEDLSETSEKFDVTVSCLAIHYISDLNCLFFKINHLLKLDGYFVFSMEHPIYTASKYPQQWVKDQLDNIIGFTTDHYGDEGERNIEWLGKNVKKYHHKIETVMNSLIKNNFVIERVIEPSPNSQLIAQVPRTIHELHRPAYLIIKCKKVK